LATYVYHITVKIMDYIYRLWSKYSGTVNVRNSEAHCRLYVDTQLLTRVRSHLITNVSIVIQ